MKKTIKTLLAMFMAIAMFISIAATIATANIARDPNRLTSLTIHHLVLPDGTIVAGNPGNDPPNARPNPEGVPVVGAEWTLWRVVVPADVNWDGQYSSIQSAWLVEVTVDAETGANGSVTVLIASPHPRTSPRRW